MRLEGARGEVVRYARRMETDDLVIATSGNVSVRVGGEVAITPSGLAYESLTAELVCVCDLDGATVEGDLEPSSELPMHLAAYETAGTSAVVHAHSTYATVLSTLVDELPPIHYLIAMFGGNVRVAPYETYGTAALARSVREALMGRSGALLAHHGAITVGQTLDVAYRRAQYLEWLSQVYFLARSGGTPQLLGDEEVARVQGRLGHYGQEVPEVPN